MKKTPRNGNEETVDLSTTQAPSITDDTVTLTLAAAVVSTDTVTVGYAKPGTGSDNTLEDAADNKVTDFTNQEVTNNTANAAPIASNNTVTTEEDMAYTFKAGDFNFTDADRHALAGVTITTLESAGALKLDGVDVTLDKGVTRTEIDADKLVFTPAANAHGNAYATFQFKVSDGTGESASAYTMTINVTAVNDAPTASDGEVTTNEDTAYAFTAADFEFADDDADDALASVKIVSLPATGKGALALDGTPVAENGVVTKTAIDAGRLTYAPPANANGDDYATFTFRVNDGEADSAATYTMTINVTPVNDAPTASDGEVTTNEDMAYAFTAADFEFDDDDTDDALGSVKIVSLPATGKGALALDGAPVAENGVVTKTAIDAGRLTYAPPANANGDDYADLHVPGQRRRSRQRRRLHHDHQRDAGQRCPDGLATARLTTRPPPRATVFNYTFTANGPSTMLTTTTPTYSAVEDA